MSDSSAIQEYQNMIYMVKFELFAHKADGVFISIEGTNDKIVQYSCEATICPWVQEIRMLTWKADFQDSNN